MIWLFLAFLLIAVSLICFSFLEARNVRIHRIDLFFNTLPAAFDGYRILHLSDLHINKQNKRTKRLLASLTAEPADLCVITGDLIEDDKAIHICQDMLKTIRPPHGVFVVLGNHDYFRYSMWDMIQKRNITTRTNDTQGLVRILNRTGFRVLRNESIEIGRNGDSVWLVGLDDPVTNRHNVKKALAPVPSEAFTILLTHTPDVIRETNFPGEHLILAGHTHGGQVLLPLWGPIMNHSSLKPGFVSGGMKLDNGFLLVSNGQGVNTLFPFRFRCRPEICTVRLRRKVPLARETGYVTGQERSTHPDSP